MPIQLSDVQPAAPAPAPDAAPAPDGAGQDPGKGNEGEIPKDVLRIPAMYGLLQGKPAAIYAPRGQSTPELATVVKHGQELVNAGLIFYAAKSKPVNVLYNTLFLSHADLEKADAAGELDKVAEPFEAVRDSFDKLRTSKEPGVAPDAPVAPVAPGAASPTAAAMGGAPAPASVQNKLATARINSLTPTNSTTGRGRILSEIQKPVV